MGATLADFQRRHDGESVVVCGCGPSLNDFQDPARFVTIGVNDVGRLFDPNYLVVVNPRNQFKGDRFAHVERSKAKALFTQLDLGPVRPPVVRFRLGQFGGTEVDARALHYTQNSPYVAVCLAALMGARRIGLVGVDFTDHHFFAATGRHSLSPRLREIDAQYGRLAQALARRGIELVNLSATSRLVSLPRVGLASDGAWLAREPLPAAVMAPSIHAPMKVEVEKRRLGIDALLLDTLAATVAALGHSVSRDPQRAVADPGRLAIVWNGSRFHGHGPTLFCEHGWLPRTDYQISPRGINADSHAAPFAWDGQPLSAGRSATLDAHTAALRAASAATAPQAMADLPAEFLLVPLQIESDTNIVRHAPANLRTMQALVDHVARANPPWPVVFKQHPIDVRCGNRHLALRMKRPQDRVWPQSRGGDIHAMLRSGRCRGILTLNSNVAHDGLLWDVPAIVLARNVWPSQGERTPFLTALPDDWSALHASVTEPEAVACRRAYAHFLLQQQWTLADARDPAKVAALLESALRSRPARPAQPVRIVVPLPVRERKVVPLRRAPEPAINVVAEDKGWLFERWKQAFVAAGHPGFKVVASARPLPQAQAWIFIRAAEAACTPDFARSVVQLHDLFDGGRYAAGGERAAVARCAGLSLTHPQQQALLAGSGIDLARRRWLLQPVGWGAFAGSGVRSEIGLPSLAWVGRPAVRGGVDQSRLDAFVQAAASLRGRARVVLLGERLEPAAQRLRAAGVDCRFQVLKPQALDRAGEWLAPFDGMVIGTVDSGPWPLFDALHAGVPVVAWRGGWADTLLADGRCGRVVDDAFGLDAALVDLVEQRVAWRTAAPLMHERVEPHAMSAWVRANLELAAELARGVVRQVA